ncbi:MAG: hypothetical protein COV59_00580 [Candidatus Magasanikbacteria bacterium CG11_big_fil_rev_8_21_14_0_20_39_34]|uniref:Uncharacterized protein n=1 Tax=Candidatus Magasanikbacteria bacterium CG11_big_fil_rev_8_21_14_0_20_39_34 TaxID=1974653 RepID=A0A2H0N6E2_9BACT|nr:MAG: hypothetical protein COV59_00580 [Candidatus Magasanikbacteria bacterium CG11_big_fil_rev_8_21_14_0_20_39_34]
MSIPLYSFLFAYILFLIFFVIFYILIVYHIHISASYTIFSFFITFFVGTCAILTFYFTWHLLSDVDWKKRVVLFENNSMTLFEKPAPIPLDENVPGTQDEVNFN